MKTMHHFCDNCLNYYSKWMAHLGWSLLSDSEKKAASFLYLLYTFCATPSPSSETTEVGGKTSLGFRWSVREAAECLRGMVTSLQQPLPPPLQQRSCMGQPLPNFPYVTCQDRFAIHSSILLFGDNEAVHRKHGGVVVVCIPGLPNAVGRGSTAPKATRVRSSGCSAGGLIQALHTTLLCRTTGLLFIFLNFCLW